MDVQPAQAFMLGDWRVSPAEDLLARGDEAVRLEPQAMAVLVYLSSRPGEVVSHTDLAQKVWRDDQIDYDAVTGTLTKAKVVL